LFTYSQSTGIMTAEDGSTLGPGYSGNGDAINDPNSQNIMGHGPIPQGDYTIGAAETVPHLGPLAMPLTPNLANEMFGRSAFFIHGDNASLDHTASDGCIILRHDFRATIAASGDADLKVVL
jgi:hypothetical protein